MKFFSIISLLFFFISCGQQEKSIKEGVIVDSLAPKNTLVINAADSIIDTSKLIIPGKSIGSVFLNEHRDSVLQKLGKPDAGDAAMGKPISIYKNKENNTEFKIYFVTNMGTQNEDSKAKLFHTNSTLFSTNNLISVGSNLQTIQKSFPALKLIANVVLNKDSLQLYDAAKEGIAFDIDSKNICRGISIHIPNETFLPTYFPFYDSYQLIEN